LHNAANLADADMQDIAAMRQPDVPPCLERARKEPLKNQGRDPAGDIRRSTPIKIEKLSWVAFSAFIGGFDWAFETA